MTSVVLGGFKNALSNYWEYYLELEDDFIATGKYVAFDEANYQSFSLEYLKLYQAVCGEIDSIGKVLAVSKNPSFDLKRSNIYKWWYVVQHAYRFNPEFKEASSTPVLVPLIDVQLLFRERIPIAPWKGFRVVKFQDSKHRTRYKLDVGSSIPKWWSGYNAVKHRRMEIPEGDAGPNYRKANLGNILSAFGALYILENLLLCASGTRDDLQRFIDDSRLFSDRQEAITASEIAEVLR